MTGSQAVGKVTVVPGIPGTGVDHLETGEYAYPGTTTDIVKLLKERGFEVEYAVPRSERVDVEHNAADIWVPILQFLQVTEATAVGTIVAQMILDLFGRDFVKHSVLHVKFSRQKPDGEMQEFEADGAGPDVIEAMRQFDEE